MCLDKAPQLAPALLGCCHQHPRERCGKGMASVGVGPAMVGEDLGGILVFLRA